MARIPTTELRRYLLQGQICGQGCLHTCRYRYPLSLSLPLSLIKSWTPKRQRLHTSSQYKQTHPSPSTAIPLHEAPPAPLRKQLKEQAKALKAAGRKKKAKADSQTVPGWELTVGIEIHAQLNTARKLFSPATASALNDTPNSHVALFDLAMPGSQPVFQKETLIPALRAALALDCDIQKISRFDRKHYFHWDQPSGYQITQYYEPFAKNGKMVLYPRDGIAPDDGESVEVGIKQIQMEQDTAKTIAQPGETHWLDFNRVGVPLIEIITLPEIHHPATAAALVRKVQLLLNSVDACVSGMEAGGLRADVNVSVRRTDGDPTATALGTRTEIKNLSSFKAVEDAVIAERDRQIALLEAGGVVEGETRGWSLGSTETRRLRGKEGEVDYRYMPDPDLGPVVIGEDLVEHLRSTMGVLPDAEADTLVQTYRLSSKDAVSLMLLDNGGRVQYFYNVLDALEDRLQTESATSGEPEVSSEGPKPHALLAANWCLHELGKLTASSNTVDGDPSAAPEDALQITPTGECRVAAGDLADILFHLHRRRITANVAKELVWAVFRGEAGAGAPGNDVGSVIERGGLWFTELSGGEYAEIADAAVRGEEKVLREFRKFRDGGLRAYPQGKLMFLVGKMMRLGPEGRMDPRSAEQVMRARIEERYLPGLDGGS
ncbi:amidotransferase-like protein [Phialemonium atrogriseum]|uniref:Glutamyl-tRNA(Gln) amidotransferase subunit B, mitochondrial n=1 Tax=Phialemonium atrogriseum TaxID=1093897 RepID=A0AAJ0FH89_9PEZI|nr:amidotransferase-like protein [Phialemonium atrogriseum]KAK1767457.1 amidotransferase-like protein [Phialemonium atrogriseum]